MHHKLPRTIILIRLLDFQDPYLFGNSKSRSFPRWKDKHIFRAFKARGPFKGCCLIMHVGARNSPRHPSNQETTFFSNFLLSAQLLYTFFFLPNTKKTHTKQPKNASKTFDSSLFTNNIRYCSYTQPSFPWFYSLDLGFRGVGVAFLAIIHTPNLTCFIAFLSMFVFLFVLLA